MRCHAFHGLAGTRCITSAPVRLAPISERRHARALCYLAFLIVLASTGPAHALDGGGAVIDEHAADPHAGATDAPPIAHRLWRNLACLCGRCHRMRLSTCTCADAARERDNVLSLLKGRDVSTPEQETAAYEAIIENYVSRFGKNVLVENSESPAFGATDWLIQVGAVGAFILMVVLVERARRYRGATAGSKNKRRRKR